MMMIMMMMSTVRPTVLVYKVRPVPPSLSMHLKLPLSLSKVVGEYEVV